MSMRVTVAALGMCFILSTGCESKSSTGGATGTTGGSDATKTAGAGGAYAKKLVGVWEGKEDLGGKEETVKVEFSADGVLKMSMGPFALKGTYKVTKEDGKTVTMDTEMSFDDPEAPKKADKKTITATFDDDNTMVMQKVGEKPEPLKLKRK